MIQKILYVRGLNRLQAKCVRYRNILFFFFLSINMLLKSYDDDVDVVDDAATDDDDDGDNDMKYNTTSYNRNRYKEDKSHDINFISIIT